MCTTCGCESDAHEHHDHGHDHEHHHHHGEEGGARRITNSPTILEAIEWCRQQLSREQLDFVRGFETGIELPLAGGHRLKLFHGSPSSNLVDLLADTPSETFDAQLGPDRTLVMAGGHTHLQMLRQHRGTLVVNPGSVGAPFREVPTDGRPTILDHAEYASVEVRDGEVAIALHRIALDRRALAKAARESANPMRAELAAAYA